MGCDKTEYNKMAERQEEHLFTMCNPRKEVSLIPHGGFELVGTADAHGKLSVWFELDEF